MTTSSDTYCDAISRSIKVSMLLAILQVLTSCSYNRSATPPSSTQNPPLYPDAHQVREGTDGNFKGQPIKFISYLVNSPPDEVKDFYKGELSKESWTLSNYSPTPAGLHFSWLEGCPVFGLDVVANLQGDGATQVELRLHGEDCE